MTKYAGT